MDKAHEIKARTDIVAVIQQDGVTLRKQGREFIGLCPFHADSDPSMKVNPNKQIFKCFSCNAGGDVYDYAYLRHGYKLKEAIHWLSGKPWQIDEAKLGAAYSKPADAKPLTVLDDAPEPCEYFNHSRLGTPAAKWAYRNEHGRIFGYACRFNLPDGKKDVVPRVYVTDGTRSFWAWYGFGRPRPIYGADLLAQRPDAPVLVVEGEKAADAARKLFPKFAVVTWQGGSDSAKIGDWEKLRGRKVTLCPDNDAPGVKAMIIIAAKLRDVAASVKWMSPPPDAAKAWDWADFEGTSDEAWALAKSLVGPVPAGALVVEPKAPKQPEPLPPAPEDVPMMYEVFPDDAQPLEEARDEMEEHFRILGFEKTDGGTLAYFFFVRGSLKVLRFTAPALSQANLLLLAPLQWWELNFPGKGGIQVNAALNWIVSVGNSRGIFDEARLRGRGAWMDGGKPVIHAGDVLYVGGQRIRLADWRSPYFYEQMGSLGLNAVKPLSKQEANKIMGFLSQLSFERSLTAYLLAGWCVIAPVCGALTWRPHIWLTGAAGTGKSWTFKYVVARLLGKFALQVQSSTTEAYVRQRLQADALPVVFDEAESNTRNAADRIQNILELVRSASSEDGGVIGKGSSMGTAKTFIMRSCFAFASIVVGAESAADQSRITTLVFKTNTRIDKQEWWAKLKTDYFAAITPEWVEGLQARTVAMLPVILKNAATFSDAAAALLGDQRTGDQLGAMLAGAYSLHSNEEISFDAAMAWMKSKDWSEEKQIEEQRDERRLIDHLLMDMRRIETSYGIQQRTVGELVAVAAGKKADPVIMKDNADAYLRRLGVKIDGDGFTVASDTTWLEETLVKTPWAKGTSHLLQRLPGAQPKASTYFSAGIKKRGTWIPFAVLGEDDAPAPAVEDDELPF